MIELQYLGTAYDGWQPQPNQSSVYDVRRCALHKCTAKRMARWLQEDGQRCHTQPIAISVRTDRSLDDHEALAAALNATPPKTARAVGARGPCSVSMLTTSVRQKTYSYYLALGDGRDDVAWRVEGLDLVKCGRAQRFVGEHDFKVFSAGVYSGDHGARFAPSSWRNSST